MSELMAALANLTDAETRELAQRFEVAPSTVGRWARGVALPHPLLAARIIAAITEIRGRQ